MSLYTELYDIHETCDCTRTELYDIHETCDCTRTELYDIQETCDCTHTELYDVPGRTDSGAGSLRQFARLKCWFEPQLLVITVFALFQMAS